MPGCKWNTDEAEYDKRSLFKLSYDPVVAERLLKQLKFEDGFTPNHNFRMCDKHFTSDSVKPYGGFIESTSYYNKPIS